MRTTLNALQWQRLRAYVNSLDVEARKALLHRCGAWEESVARELGAVANGQPASAKECSKASALDHEIIKQVAVWLKK